MSSIRSRAAATAFALVPLFTQISCAPVHNFARPTTWEPVLDRLTEAEEEAAVPLIPIPSGRTGAPFVAVESEAGGKGLLLLVDTGTSITLLRESLRPFVRVKKIAQARLERSEDEEGVRDVYTTSSLRLGNMNLGGETIAFLPDEQFDRLARDTASGIDGILGSTLLRRGEVEFDTANRALILRPFSSTHLEEREGQAGIAPLVDMPDFNTFLVPLVSDSGERSRFLIDTGSNAELTLAAEGYLGRAARESEKIGSSPCHTLRGRGMVDLYPLPENFSLSGRTFVRGTPVFLDERGDSRVQGSLGIPVFWAARRIILNHRRESVFFDWGTGV